LDKLEEHVKESVQAVIGMSDNCLVTFFDKIYQYMSENFEKSEKEMPKKASKKDLPPKMTPSVSTVESVASGQGENKEKEKKASMKTANDVVNRIQWDNEINRDYITVGYLDRFLGLKECEFNTFDWGDIVLADLGTLAIPEHRISYFKYKNEIVWDKSKRLDNFFGSTGSNVTIHDVIKRLDGSVFTQLSQINDETSDEPEIHRLGRASGKTSAIKNEPNYFVSIPVDDKSIQSNLREFKAELVKLNANIETSLLPETSLHLTVCTLRIDSEDEMKKVKSEMDRLFSSDQENDFLAAHFPINLKFQGIGEFYNKVLYVKCLSQQLDKLESIKNTLIDRFKSAGINTAGNYYDFTPHLTVVKIRNVDSNGSKVTRNNQTLVRHLVDSDVWTKYEHVVFGQFDVKQIELSKMVNIFNSLTYPVEHTVKI
jgi:2'-5' RNA ligase/uncharacterized protein (UPF0248 family)